MPQQRPDVALWAPRGPETSWGGVQRYVLQLAQALEARRLVTRIVGADSQPGFGQHNKRFVWPRRLAQLLAEKPRLVHLHGSSSLFTVQAAHACHCHRIPFVWTPCFHPFWSQKYPLLSGVYFKALERRVMGHARRVFTLSLQEQRFFRSQLPGARVELVRAGVDLQHRAEPAPAAKRKALLFVGRRSPNKGFQHLAAIDDWLAAERIRVTAVTDPKPGEALKSINCTGPLDERSLNQAYATARACVVPSSYESFSYAVVEALAHGTPVISSDQVGVMDHVGHSPACRVVPYGHGFEDGLKRQIMRFWCLSDPDLDRLSDVAITAAQPFGLPQALEPLVNALEAELLVCD